MSRIESDDKMAKTAMSGEDNILVDEAIQEIFEYIDVNRMFCFTLDRKYMDTTNDGIHLMRHIFAYYEKRGDAHKASIIKIVLDELERECLEEAGQPLGVSEHRNN